MNCHELTREKIPVTDGGLSMKIRKTDNHEFCFLPAFAFFFLFVFLLQTGELSGMDLFLKSGEQIRDAQIVSKNQFGINIREYVDSKTGRDVLRHIRFYDLSTSSLDAFPFCDVKTNDRIVTALNDRAAIAERKYKDKRAEAEKDGDFAKHAMIPGGISSMKIFFISEEETPDGTIGWAHSDTPEAVLYGKLYIYGIRIPKGQVWLSEVFTTMRAKEYQGKQYPLFTCFKNSRAQLEEEKEKAGSSSARGGRQGENGKEGE